MSHVLTADGGTESLRVRIYDLNGTCVASHAEPYETKFLSGARAEQNAGDWWSSLVKATIPEFWNIPYPQYGLRYREMAP